MFWNCQGVRSKCKELVLYLKENSFDIVILIETFLTKKVNFKIQGYDTIKNDRSTDAGGGFAFLVKHVLVINKGRRTITFLSGGEVSRRTFFVKKNVRKLYLAEQNCLRQGYEGKHCLQSKGKFFEIH